MANSKTSANETTEARSTAVAVVSEQVESAVANNRPQRQQEAADDLEQAEMAKRAKHHKKWNRRLKIFFCCLGYKKNKDSIADVASIFAEFYSDLDVPSSDIAAGFVLLSKYQAAQRNWIVKNQQLGVEQYLSSVPITAKTNFLDISTAEDSHLINDLIYYMNYGLAIFGWPMQMVDDPCMLCCICPYLKLSRCCGGRRRKQIGSVKETKQESNDKSIKKGKHTASVGQQPENENQIEGDSTPPPVERQPVTLRKQSVTGKLDDDCDVPIILEDNCCGCNVASVERRLAAHNYEIIYVSYKVNVNVVPFLVAADHSKQTIVVAMRGSMSLSDMVTDMNGQTDKLPIDDCPEDWLCHRGITRASSYVMTTLFQEHILDRAFNCRPDLGSQDYNLVLCGHSLGAGVAAILGILMRKHYPSLKAYLYSPPGGILSLPAVEYTKQFATGIFLGNDCVPRLGIAQLERLRYQVLLSLKSSQKSTGKILAKALCPTCCFGGNKVDYDPSLSLNLLHGTEGRSFDYNGSKIPFQVQPQVLYVPGRLIHVVKNHTFKSRARRLFNEPIYQAIWNENTAYDRIMISEGMFYDHLPNNLMHAMKMLFSKTLPARKESKSSNVVASSDREPCEPTSNGGLNFDQRENDHRKMSEVIRKVEYEGEHEPVIENDNNNNNHSKQTEFDDNNNIQSSRNFTPERTNSSTGKDTLPSTKHESMCPTDHSNQGDAVVAVVDKSFDANGNDETVLNKNHSNHETDDHQ